MKKLFFVLSMCLFSAFSLVAEDAKPLYQLPDKKVDIPDNNVVNSSSFSDDVFLVGSDLGLYKVTNSNTAIPVGKDVFENVRIDQIFPVKLPTEDGKYTAGWLTFVWQTYWAVLSVICWGAVRLRKWRKAG